MAYLHTQTLTRVIHKSKVILSSYDMCKCGKEEKSEDFKWWETVTDSVYDITLKQITPLLLKSRILKVCPKKTMDLFIYLENDLCLQVLNSTVEECELYRIFDNHEEHDIIVPDLWE